jgi:hypothetical protein
MLVYAIFISDSSSFGNFINARFAYGNQAAKTSAWLTAAYIERPRITPHQRQRR